ncbi:methyltransferase domain-containing protein [Inquilinus limosus]|uniref:methyltransferase domain-containing protein n=1 Tax=Inquilinus limosus TaxID=171674 RepID=UPI003F15283E
MAIGGEFTRRLLNDAGIAGGMRVLDVGCGSGDVTLLAAELVGPTGAVVGVDHEAGVIAAARDRAGSEGFSHVAFEVADLASLSDLGVFDAIVGRRVLMYQPDPVQALRNLHRFLRTDGLVVLQEHDTTMVPASVRQMPLHAMVQGWIKQTLEREGADTHMGFHLHEALTAAGLMVEQVRAEPIVQTPTQKYPVGAIIRAMLPRIVQHGVATEEEVDIETLDSRLDAERLSTGATYVGDVMFGAWARKRT